MKRFKIRIILITVVLLVLFFTCAPVGSGGGSGSGSNKNDFIWPKRLGGTSDDRGNCITTDTGNNIIVTGCVLGDADLNGDGDTNDLGEDVVGYALYDIIISKFDSGGSFQWSKRLGGTLYDNGHSVTTDTGNNIIVTGDVSGNADLNGDGDTNDQGEDAAGYGSYDIFISKFNSEGTFQWSKRLGGAGYDYGYSITTDTGNNIIVTGSVTGNADLDGDGIVESSGSCDIFISKFNSEGSFLWSKRLGGISSDYGNSITTDTGNNIIVTGDVSGNADLNGDGDTNDLGENAAGYGYRDIFISCFNTDGLYLWSKRLGGEGYDFGNSITTDTGNNIIVTGSVTGNSDLNGDGDTNDQGEDAAGYGSDDIFISKFDSGGSFQWSKRLGGTNIDEGKGITTDTGNNIIVSGRVYGSADLDGNGTAESFGYGIYDIFISKFDSEGTFQWSKRLGRIDSSTGSGYSITTDTGNNIIVTGFIAGDADLNGDGDMNDLGENAAGYGNNDIFISRFIN